MLETTSPPEYVFQFTFRAMAESDVMTDNNKVSLYEGA